MSNKKSLKDQFYVDEKLNLDVYNSIQTILDVFSAERKKLKAVRDERDFLLARIKTLEAKNQEFIQNNDARCVANLNQQERINVEPNQHRDDESMESVCDTSIDRLNAAFHLSASENEVIEPTQYQQFSSKMQKIKKNTTVQKERCLKEQNKENTDNASKTKISPEINEKSPTVLSKYCSKIDIQQINKRGSTYPRNINLKNVSVIDNTNFSPTMNLSPKWHSKQHPKNITPRRLFDVWSSPKETVTASTRKKLCSSLNMNTKRLKQSTISFPKEDETYCHAVSTDILLNKEDNLSLNNSNVSQNLYTEGGNSILNDKDDSVAILNTSNEVIMIEESQPTQELYQHVLEIKNELLDDTLIESQDYDTLSRSTEPSEFDRANLLQKDDLNCEDCNEYHRMIGRDITKKKPKKYGVCSKHRRNIQCLDTPPGFWNPKIIDSDSDHEDTQHNERLSK